MSTPNLQAFQREVNRICKYLQEFLDGGDRRSDVPKAFNALLNFPGTSAHGKALLPMADLVGSAWPRVRFQSPPPPLLASPVADSLFLLAAGALPPVNTNFDARLLLNASAWAPGERTRLLKPLGAILQFAATPGGLPSLKLDATHLPAYNFDIGANNYMGYNAIQGTLTLAVKNARELAMAIERHGDAELRVARAELFPASTIDAAAWEVMLSFARADPAVGDIEMRLFACRLARQTPQYQSTQFEDADAAPAEAVARCADVASFLVGVAGVMARPGVLRNMSEATVDLVLTLAVSVAANALYMGLEPVHDVISTRRAALTLGLAARCARDRALASAAPCKITVTLWFTLSLLTVHPPRSWAGLEGDVMPPATMRAALRQVADASNCMVRIRAGDAESSELLQLPLMLFATALVYAQCGSLGQASTGGAAFGYLAHARGDPNDYAAVLGAFRAFLALASASGANATDLIVGATLPLFALEPVGPQTDDVSIELAMAAVETAVDLCKAALGSRPGTLPPGERNAPHGELFSWLCASSFTDACSMTAAVCMALPQDADDGRKQRLDASRTAAALKFLHAVEKQAKDMKEMFSMEDMDSVEEAWSKIALLREANSIARAFMAMELELTPALTEADAKGLEVLKEVLAGCEVSNEALQWVEGVAARAAAVAADDAAAAMARARLLAELDCSYLGCTNVRPGGAKAPKRCAGCRCCRYCGPSCQTADWPAHKVACRAIRAESST